MALPTCGGSGFSLQVLTKLCFVPGFPLQSLTLLRFSTMKKLILILISCCTFFSAAFAQNNAPIQFRFNIQQQNDSIYNLIVQASIQKGIQLFTVNPANAEDAFISTLQLDSVSSKYLSTKDTATIVGTLQTATQADGSVYRFFTDSVSFIYPLHAKVDSAILVKGSFAWLAKKTDEFPSGQENFIVELKPNSTTKNNATATDQQESLLSIFLLTFATGLFAIFTPCVFPLIPVTVSFFLKRSGSRSAGIRNALLYSLSIISIYTIPTLILTLIFGDSILYTIATSAISNLLFFVIFIVFAISFFGAFELTLPNSWANKADEKAGKGGISGIFFMALTLVIVSFSCTGPIVGTLLGETSTKGVSIAPILGMFGFGLGLALPFSLFAFFPSMLQSLPKSGGWLNAVKVTFGFIELALALKFLSNVDLIYHWGLLDRDVFLTLWIVIFTLMGFYLLGKLKFSHDSDVKYISVPRLFFAIAAFAFSTYMIPGLWGAPLKFLSGFIPPATTQDFNLDQLKYGFSNGSNSPSSKAVANPPKKLTDKLKVPFGLTAYFDLEEGMAAAKALNKPVMLDFTGHSCANCREMEVEVWSNPEVLKRIKENFVLVSLYVDEKTDLPIAEHYTDIDGNKITNVGDKNLDYEKTKFGFRAQPLYKFLDTNGNSLSDVNYGYDANIGKFIQHLDAVKAKFDALK